LKGRPRNDEPRRPALEGAPGQGVSKEESDAGPVRMTLRGRTRPRTSGGRPAGQTRTRRQGGWLRCPPPVAAGDSPPAWGWVWRSVAGSTGRAKLASRRCSSWSSGTWKNCCERGRPTSHDSVARCGRWSSECCVGSCGVAWSNTGTSSHNRYYHCTTPTPRRVTITRRHHPLQGLLVELLHTGSR
jgi:hypothetical protein